MCDRNIHTGHLQLAEKVVGIYNLTFTKFGHMVNKFGISSDWASWLCVSNP